MTATRAALEGTDHDALTRATERMTAAEIKLETATHEASSNAGGGSAGKPSGNSSEKAVDAEFEEVAGR